MKLTELKYISEKREKDFNRLGVFTAEDLVRLYPRDYADLTHVTLITEAEHNAQALEQLAGAQKVQNDRLEALEKQIRLNTLVTPQQVRYMNDAIRNPSCFPFSRHPK